MLGMLFGPRQEILPYGGMYDCIHLGCMLFAGKEVFCQDRLLQDAVLPEMLTHDAHQCLTNLLRMGCEILGSAIAVVDGHRPFLSEHVRHITLSAAYATGYAQAYLFGIPERMADIV